MTLRSIDGGQATGRGQATGGAQAREAEDVGASGIRPDPRAPQMPWMSVYLTVKDMESSLDFYHRAFGFEPGTTLRDEGGALQHGEMQYKDEIPVMFMPETAEGCPAPSPVTLGVVMPVFFYFYHDDVDALFARARAAGAQVEMEPADMPWGDRMASLVCPNGYRWSFGTHLGHGDSPPEAAA